MRCNPLRWLWGLIPILMLAWLAAIAERERIEQDLAKRVTEGLSKAGLSWAATGFAGRDAVLTGRALEDAEPGTASDIVRKTWGVRSLVSRAELVEKADTYAWGANLRDNRVRLNGFYPNEAARRDILSVARASLPNREIEDRMKPARGAPPRDAWLGAISFGLKQLAGLKQGAVELEALDLTVAGEAANGGAYRGIRSALGGNLPSGVKIKADRVTPPVVSPYTWSAVRTERQVTLTGHAPSDSVKSDVAKAARTFVERTTLADRTEVAAGAPDGWAPALTIVLRQLGALEEGRADLSGTAVTVKGVASDEGTAKSIRQALRSGLPRGFRLTEEISFKAPEVPTIRPFTTGLDADARTAFLSGYVPSEAARAALVETVKARLPGRRIDDQLKVADGAPDGWQACMQAGVASLGKLGAGKIEKSDRRLVLRAETGDEALATAVPGELRAAANRACDTDAQISLAVVPEPDLSWTATHGDGTITLSGEVPDQASKAALAASAGRLFPNAKLVDRTRIADKPAARWTQTAEFALQQLAKLREGNARIERQQLTVAGTAADTAVATAVRQALARDVGRGYSGRDAIEVRSDAMIWAEQEAQRKAEADARRRAEQEQADKRAAAEADAKRQSAEAAEARRRKAEADEKRAAEEAEAKRRAAAEAEAKRQATEAAEARRKAETEAKRRTAEAEACQRTMRDVASSGVILFERASAEINDKSFSTLDRVAKAAAACPGYSIEVGGHTDAEGTPERNKALSERRAASIRDYLVKAGLPADRMSAVGFGAEQPVAPNDTAANRARNRRIEFTVKSN